MNIKRPLAVLSLVLAAAAVAALAQGPDVLAMLGLNPASAREGVVEGLTGSVYNEMAFKAFRALSPAARASVVKSGLAWIKAHTATAEFKADYTRYRTEQKPKPAEAVPTIEDFLKKQRLEMEKQAAEMRKAAAGMDAATRKSLEDGVKQMMAQIEAMEKDPGQRAQIKEMLDGQRAESKERDAEALAEWEKRAPADPKILIAGRIREFLETSAEVDFAAKLVKQGTLLKFVNEEYEGKSKDWKLCFRAGKEAVEAARAFAKSWLAELEK